MATLLYIINHHIYSQYEFTFLVSSILRYILVIEVVAVSNRFQNHFSILFHLVIIHMFILLFLN